MQSKEFRLFLYTLSFIEGANVMICELAGAKMLAPYFGTSLYVWAAALAVTLGGLMLGYFSGGILSRNVSKNQQTLFIVLLLAAVGLIVMPTTGKFAMDLTIHLSLKTGAILALCIFMFPPLFLMGMVSPIIINLLNRETKEAGNSSGNIYAISTLGGILATFFMGFYLIPEFGLHKPLIAGGLLLAIPVFIFTFIKYSAAKSTLGILICFTLSWLSLKAESEKSKDTLYLSEGLMGKLEVKERFFPELNKKLLILAVNNTWQTIMDPLDESFDYWPYTRAITALIPSDQKDILLLGMGGGTVARRLLEKNKNVVAVEIDERISIVAKTYFKLPEEVDIVCNDARYLIRTSKQMFDCILYDVFKGEAAPEHLLSLECIQEAGERLNQDGRLIFNMYGYLDGAYGALARALIKTLNFAGYYCYAYVTPGEPDHRNLILVASRKKIDTPQTIHYNQDTIAYATEIPALADSVILTDEKPQLHLFASAAYRWRQLYRNLPTNIN
jgi:spermidine synthase